MKPKLLLVADTFYPKVDGTLIFMEEFIKRAHNLFETTLLVPRLEKKSHNIKHVKNIVYAKTYKHISLSDYPSIKLNIINRSIIRNTIKKADIVFVQGPALLSFASIYYAHKLKKKVIFFPHVLSWEVIDRFLPLPRFVYKSAKKIALHFFNYCSLILVPYRDLADELKKDGIKVPMEITKLGVDINRFNPTDDLSRSKVKVKMPVNKKIIGYVGRISKEKNVETLLKAFKNLQDQHQLHLLLVGNGPKDQIDKFKDLTNVTITGFVNNVQDYLKAMDIFVMPSTTETTSLATLEAMATGLPVIASKVGYIKNYVTKDHNGLFFAKNSSNMLAMKIEKLLHNPELRRHLGQNARNTMAYSFSWERSINRIKRLLLDQSA